MTDTDPRLKAVAKALRPISGIGKGLAEWWAKLLCTGYDALRAFDQAALSGAVSECYTDCDDQFCPLYHPSQPESEVMPHQSGSFIRSPNCEHNAMAPVMGADPPWLDQWALTVHKNRLATSSLEAIKHIAREAIAFANAQPPSAAEIDEAMTAYLDEAPCDIRIRMRAALIAAAKAGSGG